MGKFKRVRVNPDKNSGKKNKGGLGPCGLKWLGKRCKKIKREAKSNSKCKTSCKFNNKNNNKKLIVA